MPVSRFPPTLPLALAAATSVAEGAPDWDLVWLADAACGSGAAVCATIVPANKAANKTTTISSRTAFLQLKIFRLRINSALPDGIRRAINGQHISGNPIVDAVSFGVPYHVVERSHHYGFELFVYE